MSAPARLPHAAAHTDTTTSWHRAALDEARLTVASCACPDGAVRLDLEGAPLVATLSRAEPGWTLAVAGDLAHPDAVTALAALVEAAFQHAPEADRIVLAGLAGQPAALALATAARPNGRDAVVTRAGFYQLPLLWRRAAAHVTYPALANDLGPPGRPVPLRPPQPRGLMYERWQPQLGTMLRFRPIDRRRDLALFHGWMNEPRVAFYWELAQSADELDRYLAAQEADPHIFGVIGSFDDEPVGYFEIYWAKEDRLGPYYEPDDYDRGWHGLVGNRRHLGRPKTLAWFRSLTHYLFLDDPRTMRIMGEPRASHHKMLSYCDDAAYTKVKEFDFPHKRAALVCCERERFFREVAL
jgi:acetyl CoA:N6-hydroxylysine acetyl transferase